MKLIYLLVFMFAASLIIVSASYCCQFNDDQCTFYDLGNWDQAEVFCTNTGNMLGFGSTFYESECSTVVSEDCCNGWSDCNEDIPTPTNTGSSGGHGSSSRRDCVEQWECSPWNECTGTGVVGTRTRTCTDKNECGTAKNRPIVMQSCMLNEKTEQQQSQQPVEEIQKPRINVEQHSFLQSLLSSVTGAVVGPTGISKSGLPVLFLVILVTIALIYIIKKNKEDKK